MRLFWLPLALPLAVLCQPTLEPIVERGLAAEIAAWVTGIGIWATLGYTVYDQSGQKIARFFLRTRSRDGSQPSQSDLESAISASRNTILRPLGMTTISAGSSGHTIDESQFQRLQNAVEGLIPLPPITEDEHDFFLEEFVINRHG
ncbi:hypothetical protein F5X99DRAFT_428847 [Biscogniauxia marginata]|nr:hypothetical protein F5X99DRAFT_428847 [Biscogniauxia marginata]